MPARAPDSAVVNLRISPHRARREHRGDNGGAAMSVNLICNHNVVTIERGKSIRDAAESMRREHVGDLIVVEQRDIRHVPVGILTDRDIVVSVVARGGRPDDVTVGDAMSTRMLSVNKDNGIEFALREMRRHGVRRAPVVGDGGELIGVLSIDDVIDHLAVQLGHIAGVIRSSQENEARARP
jgi:CBS domain-containing protein